VAAGTLHRSVKTGGLGLPNLTAYHRAAYLHNITQINRLTDVPQWVTIEASKAPHGDFRSLMWKQTKNNRELDALLPTTQTLLRVWNTMKRELVSKPTLPLAMPMRTIGLEIPTFPWEIWVKGGVHHMYQMIDR
ncbi:Hypothetical predicted protein, partial [Pelobates cultripes]